MNPKSGYRFARLREALPKSLVVRTNGSRHIGRSDKVVPKRKDYRQGSIIVFVILKLDLVEPCLLEHMGAILAEVLRIPHAGDALGVLDLDDRHQRAAGFEL